MKTNLLLILLFATAAQAQPFDAAVIETIRAVPGEQLLADSSLHVVNLYRTQAVILGELAGHPADAVVERLVREVYAPHASFWDGYMGSEANFRSWSARSLLDSSHVIYSRLAPLSRLHLDRLYEDAVAWLEATAGRRPQGTWYLIFGPGWTDMGGMGDGAMVVDFSKMIPDSARVAALLPHELTHQVHGPALDRAGDPDVGTVLHRIVAEGFASYVAALFAGGVADGARAVGYTSAEWAWASSREAALWEATRPLLASTSRDDINLVASRTDQITEGAPGAAGYFLGYRIVEAFVARHGAESWKTIFDLPVAEVLARSGYAPAAP